MKQALFYVVGISALFLAVGLPAAFCVGKRAGAGPSSSSTPIDPALIAAIAAATVIISGAIGSTTVLIIKSLRETKDVNRAQTAQLATIAATVDGTYGLVLRELAEVRVELANVTGASHQRALAAGAEKVADDHDRVVEKVKIDAVVERESS